MEEKTDNFMLIPMFVCDRGRVQLSLRADIIINRLSAPKQTKRPRPPPPDANGPRPLSGTDISVY